MSVKLTNFVETFLADERLLPVLRGGEGVSLDVARLQLLRGRSAQARRGSAE